MVSKVVEIHEPEALRPVLIDSIATLARKEAFQDDGGRLSALVGLQVVREPALGGLQCRLRMASRSEGNPAALEFWVPDVPGTV